MSKKQMIQRFPNKVKRLKAIQVIIYFLNYKDIAHVAMQGTSEPHDMLPGTDGDSDNQNVPPSRSSTYI